MADVRDDIKDTDADTRDDIKNEDSVRDDIIKDTDADTRDDMRRFDDIDSALERITRAIEALANGVVKGNKADNPEQKDSKPGMKRIEDLNL